MLFSVADYLFIKKNPWYKLSSNIDTYSLFCSKVTSPRSFTLMDVITRGYQTLVTLPCSIWRLLHLVTTRSLYVSNLQQFNISSPIWVDLKIVKDQRERKKLEELITKSEKFLGTKMRIFVVSLENTLQFGNFLSMNTVTQMSNYSYDKKILLIINHAILIREKSL